MKIDRLIIRNVRYSFSFGKNTDFTAIPVVACLLQYLDGSIRKPGLWLQANIVEPNRFMEDMKRMGIDVWESIPSEKVQDKSGNGR